MILSVLHDIDGGSEALSELDFLRLVVHMDARQYWNDMNRDNDLNIDGYHVLRFPAWIVRHQPEMVAAKIRDALRNYGGYRL
jgi:very-short-patch-repair endonuclease